MDAARTLLKQIALFSAVVLLVAVPAAAQTLVLSSNDVTLTSTAPVNVTVSSTGAAIPFTVSKAAEDTWYTVSPLQGTAGSVGVSLAIQLINTNCFTVGGGCTGTISINGSTDTKTITVHYGTTGGGGTGTFVVTPTSVSMSSTGTAAVQQDVAITSNSGAAITYTVSAPLYQQSGVGWLSTQTTFPQSVSAAGGATLRLIANPTSLPNGVYSASVTVTPSTGSAVQINVTFTVGATTSLGTVRPNTNPVGFSWTSTTGTLIQTVGLTSTNLAVTTFSAQATSTGGWLSMNGFQNYSGNVASGLPLTVLNAAASLLATGNYTGYVTITNPANSQDTSVLTVNLSVNGGAGSGLFNPASVTFNAALGGALQQASVVPTGTGLFSWTVPSACNTWLGVTQNSSGGFTLTAYPTALSANGTYNCDVAFTKDGATYGSLPVSLIIGSGTGGGTTGNPVGPTTLNFAYQSTGASSPGQQQITVGGTGAYSIAVDQGSGGAFISASTSGSSAPGTIFVNVLGGRPVGNYTGTINVTTPSGTTPVTVNLLVTANPVVIINPSSINFSYNTGDTSYNSSLTVSMSDASSRAVTVSTTDSWILVSGGTSANTPSSYQVTVNPVGLANGLRSGSITVSSPGAGNPTVSIPVTVLVNNSSTGTLGLSASQLNFTAVSNGAAPAAQTLTVTAASGTTYTASVSGTNCSWMGVSPSGTLSGSQNLTVSVSPSGLAASTTAYTCNIALTANGVTQTVPVNFTVTAPTGGTGDIAATPTSITFNSQVGTTPAAQQLTVTTTVTGGVAFSVSFSSNGNWLNAGVANGSSFTTTPILPVTLTITANTTGLGVGTYQGNITLTPNGGKAVSVPVTLNVQSTAVSVVTTPLNFTWRRGDGNPASQTLAVTGATGLSFTASAASTGNWLAVSPASGTTGSNLTISVTPGSLTPGAYNGTITVTGVSPATGTSTVTVNLTVTAPAPNIDKVTNAASNVTNGSIAAGEIITLVGTNMGPATLVPYQIDSTGKFATTLSGVQVLINGVPAPLIYVWATQVAAIVPYEIASPFIANPTVRLTYQTVTSNTLTVPQLGSVPGIFTANSTGSGPAAILNGNGSYNLPGSPAAKGETIQIFVTGEGQTTPAGVTGKITTVTSLPSGFPFTPQPILAIAVLIDSQPAQVVFWGEAPGAVSGLMQINAIVPLASRSGEVPIQVLIGGGVTQTGVTVSVR